MKKMVTKFFMTQKTRIITITALGVLVCAYFLSTMNAVAPTVASNEGLPLNAAITSPQGVHIDVRVADTDETRELGLSYMKSLPNKQGMLFVFPQVGIYSFWMKGMNFPIDIIWIDEYFKIIDRSLSVLPSSYPNTVTPQSPVRYVLEIPSGTADEYGFTIGSSVVIENNK